MNAIGGAESYIQIKYKRPGQYNLTPILDLYKKNKQQYYVFASIETEKYTEGPQPHRTHTHARTYIYTLSALIDLPITMAIHSPAGVECPVFIVIGAICGDQARFVISFCPEYAITGSVSTRFFPSDGLGELNRELALRGDAAGAGA